MSSISGGDEHDAWSLVFAGYDPADEGRREALCALGNGMYMSRAAAPDAVADQIHYPGTYRAGCYNRLTSRISGEEVTDESAVNLPNWLPLTFRIAGGPWLTLDSSTILSYTQTLDLRHGLLRRELRLRDQEGRHTTLRETRLVSMSQPHLAALQLQLTAEDWSGDLELRSAIDGRVINDNVARYGPFSKIHLEHTGDGVGPAGVWLSARTTRSRIAIAVAARTAIDGGTHESRQVLQEPGQIAELIGTQLERGTTLTVEKITALFTSRDPATDESGAAAQRAVEHAPDFAELRAAHERAWARLWAQCDIDAEPAELMLPLRLNLFHLRTYAVARL